MCQQQIYSSTQQIYSTIYSYKIQYPQKIYPSTAKYMLHMPIYFMCTYKTSMKLCQFI